MKKIENECVNCKEIGLHCLGCVCPYKEVIRFYCDQCGEEEALYHFDEEELCINCILKRLEVVEGSE